MNGMFNGCAELQSIPKLNIDTSNVTDMYKMFADCLSLSSLDLSSIFNTFNTTNVNDMRYMFYYCESLISLDLSIFDTSNVTEMDSMFDNCISLISLDLSSFNTSNVTSMYRMFYYCTSLISLDLSSFDTSNVYNMDKMFLSCAELQNIDGIIDMKSCTDYSYMFSRRNKLSGIKIKNPPQQYYDDKVAFEDEIGLTSSQYEIVS